MKPEDNIKTGIAFVAALLIAPFMVLLLPFWLIGYILNRFDKSRK